MGRMLVPTLALFALVGLACGDGDNGTTEPVITTGSVEVLLTMTGEYLDADGCQVSIDGGDSRLLEPGGPVMFTELSPDAHSLLVDGVAANCSIQGQNPRDVNVVAGQTVQTTYVIECTPCGVGWIGYEATDLGTLGGRNIGIATGINDRGQVVGYSYVDSNAYHAFLWENGVMTDLGSYDGYAVAINNAGQVLISGGGHAFLWDDGVVTEIGESWTRAINNRGQVVGFLYLPELRFAMWQNGVITDLGSLDQFEGYALDEIDDIVAEAVNEHGQVIVNIWSSELDWTAVLWDDGVIKSLTDDPRSGSYGMDIDDHGRVVGLAPSSSPLPGRGFLWEDGVLTHLDGFDALGINNCGQVVGYVRTSAGAYHAALWENGVITDLGVLDASWPHSIGNAINIHGQVVGYSYDQGDPNSSEDNVRRATLWTPIR